MDFLNKRAHKAEEETGSRGVAGNGQTSEAISAAQQLPSKTESLPPVSWLTPTSDRNASDKRFSNRIEKICLFHLAKLKMFCTHDFSPINISKHLQNRTTY